MSDEQFPSGRWVGFYTYRSRPEKHRMDMTLTFENGVLQGEGRDDIDRFVLRGTYEANEAVLIKDYWGLPSVCHRGFRDGFKTALWGGLGDPAENQSHWRVQDLVAGVCGRRGLTGNQSRGEADKSGRESGCRRGWQNRSNANRSAFSQSAIRRAFD